jgi:diguanylate cyclase (GGDEF)-like protein
MNRKLLAQGAGLAVLPLVLLAGWLYLYANSQAVDTQAQNQTLVLLKDLKQLDSEWSANVLRSHASLHTNYDTLVEPLRPFADGLARLRAQTMQLRQGHLVDTVSELAVAIDNKGALIESFKAETSLFKNSLRYAPTAHLELWTKLRARPRIASGSAGSLKRADTAGRQGATSTPCDDGAKTLVDELGVVVNEALRFSALPDDAGMATVRAGIDSLRGRAGCFPPDVRGQLFNLLLHLDALLSARASQTTLLHTISGLPVAARIDALGAALTQGFNAELVTQFRYQRLLLVYSALALLLVSAGAVYIGYRQSTDTRRLRGLVDAKTTELHLLATRDELTRVHNRRHLSALLEQQRAQHARSGVPLCIALLDIDHFKSINDRHGHATGDAVLQRFASVSAQTLRDADLLGRWGGEEFLVALPGTSADQAEQVLNRLRQALNAADFTDLGSDLHPSFSAGLVLLGPDEPVCAAIERADQAMYRAKSAGRNRVETG